MHLFIDISSVHVWIRLVTKRKIRLENAYTGIPLTGDKAVMIYFPLLCRNIQGCARLHITLVHHRSNMNCTVDMADTCHGPLTIPCKARTTPPYLDRLTVAAIVWKRQEVHMDEALETNA